MKYTELKNFIEEHGGGVYLLEGNDAYFRLNGERLIKNARLQMPELNYSTFEGEGLKGSSLTALVSACKNYPFMAEYRIIKVTEFYPSESDYEKYLKPLFEDFPQTTILVIVNAGGKKGGDLKRKKTVNYFDCNHAEQESVAKWAFVTLKRAGIKAPASVCSDIAAYCLCDMSRVSVEVQKLIDYKGQGELSAEEAEALVYKDAEYRIYELTNTLPRRDYNAYVKIRNDVLKKGGDETSVLNGLYNFVRSLFTAYTSDLSDKALADTLGVKEFIVNKNRRLAESMGANRLKELTLYLYGRISDVKNGRLTPPSALQSAENKIFFG